MLDIVSGTRDGKMRGALFLLPNGSQYYMENTISTVTKLLPKDILHSYSKGIFPPNSSQMLKTKKEFIWSKKISDFCL